MSIYNVIYCVENWLVEVTLLHRGLVEVVLSLLKIVAQRWCVRVWLEGSCVIQTQRKSRSVILYFIIKITFKCILQGRNASVALNLQINIQ